MSGERLEVSVTYDASCGYIGSVPGLKAPVVAWPIIARAQQGDLAGVSACSCHSPRTTRLGAFQQGLQQLGWSRNVRIDYRWGPGDTDRIRGYAAELVTLAPDVILGPGSAAVGALLQATRTVPKNRKRRP